MRRLKDLLNNKGLTLMELIIVMALIGIIISLAFSMNIFGVRAFNIGSHRSELNNEANIVSEYITKHLRFAYGVEILAADDTIPDAAAIASSATSKDAYIFVTNDGAKAIINYRDKNGTKVLGTFDGCTLSVTSAESDKALSYRIAASHKGESYSVDSGVVPINLLIQRDAHIIDNTGTVDGAAIRIINDVPMPASSEELSFNPTDPSPGEVGKPYVGYALSASGGTAPYTFSVSSSTRLPYGMTLSSEGALSGTPIEAGTFTIKIYVFDSSSPNKSASNTIILKVDNDTTVDPNAPSVVNVEITGPESINMDGTAASGSLLSVAYIYIDPEGEYEGTTEFSWYSGIKIDGTDMGSEPIAATKEYRIASGDVGKYLFVRVTPRSIHTGEGPGVPAFCTNPVKATAGDTNAKPVVSNVHISGSPTVGSTLTGQYTYYDAEGDAEGASVYKWYRSSKNDGTNKKDTGSIGKTYTIKSSDKNMYIFFEVTPRAVTGASPGDTVMSSNIGPVSGN